MIKSQACKGFICCKENLAISRQAASLLVAVLGDEGQTLLGVDMIIVPVESCSFKYAKIRWREVVIERSSGAGISEIKALTAAAAAAAGDISATTGTMDFIGVEAKARG
ncbi:hypothetical protein ACLB2K_061651 [Fragaria x ananassa]